MTQSTDPLRDRLVARVRSLPDSQLDRVAEYLTLLEAAAATDVTTRESKVMSPIAWPHAPIHRISNFGTYIVTASTLLRKPRFCGPELLDFLQESLLNLAHEHCWTLEAWAVFPNHYHFVAYGSETASPLDEFLTMLHANTARELNALQSTPARQVWFNFWETELTYEKSYLARLAYVHQNAVHHGLVSVANQYRWCSAAWFERTATPAQVKTIYGFKTDQIKLRDDYQIAREDVM